MYNYNTTSVYCSICLQLVGGKDKTNSHVPSFLGQFSFLNYAPHWPSELKRRLANELLHLSSSHGVWQNLMCRTLHPIQAKGGVWQLVSSTKLPWVARIALEELAEPEAGARGAGQGRCRDTQPEDAAKCSQDVGLGGEGVKTSWAQVFPEV